MLPTGRLPSGAFTFTPWLSTAPTGFENAGEIVLPAPILAQVVSGKLVLSQAAGYGPLTLYANDDPGTTPVGIEYRVTEALTYGSLSPWTFVLHHTGPNPLTLASVRPTP